MRKTLFLAATLMVATLGSAFAEDMQGVIQAAGEKVVTQIQLPS